MALSETLPLPVCRADALKQQPPEQAWLIQDLWAQAAVGVIGGQPKSCKSWLGLEMAVSVASGTPCLGHFPVAAPGPALVYLAEDTLAAVRARLEALCAHRQLPLAHLELYAITAPTLHLDLAQDQQRLQATVASLRPRLVLLDPLVRMHQGDENSAADISTLLGFLRTLQRTHDSAIVLVHHASKKHRAHPGQALRGSSDLHAWGDSNAYLARRQDQLILTLEHRAAKPPAPFAIALVCQPDGSQPHLELCCAPPRQAGVSLAERILHLLQHSPKPLPRTTVRQHLKVNNQRLGQALAELQQQGQVLRTPSGWTAMSSRPPESAPTCSPTPSPATRPASPLAHTPDQYSLPF